MKKNDWILLGSVATYSYLFYQQTAGINWLIFTILLISLLLIRNRDVYKNTSWLFAATGSVLSACCVAYYGDSLSIISNIISLCILSAFSIEPRTSVILSFFFSVYSLAASAVYMILDAIERYRKKENDNGTTSGTVKLMLYLVPILIAVVFFFMYKASNPVFDNFTKKISLDFITIGWFFFTLGGFFLMYAFFYHKSIRALAIIDQAASGSLLPAEISQRPFTGFSTINNEKLSGIILFVLLNTLLLAVNLLDLNFLWFDGALPKDLSYSDFVHQGTGALITSIIIAILIILFYFRGALNFNEGNKTLKLLAALWIIQNAFMIISTAYRNNLYINEYGLTFKRIGVYIWLLLVLIGLITTFIKVQKAKSNWFLFRVNGWLFYGVLVVSAFVGWSSIVTDFNIKRAENNHKRLDIHYLISLSDRNIPQLLTLNDSVKTRIGYGEEWGTEFQDYYPSDFPGALDYKLYCFLSNMQEQQWQSFCFQKENTYDRIMAMKEDIKQINVSNHYLNTIKPLEPLSALKAIEFGNNRIEKLEELKLFPKLEKLHLGSNSLDTIYTFPFIESLTELSLAGNNFVDASPLKNVPNIEILDLSGNQWLDLRTLPVLKKMTVLNINGVNCNDYSPLQQYPELQELSIGGINISRSTELPNLPNLKVLNLHGKQLTQNDIHFFQSLENVDNLEKLNLSYNSISCLEGILTYVEPDKQRESWLLPICGKLNVLDLSNNSLNSISSLIAFPLLQELNLSNNPIKDLSPLQYLKQLKVLTVRKCDLRTLEMLQGLENLEMLDISDNLIRDFTPLYKLKKLKELTIESATKHTLELLQKALPGTRIKVMLPAVETR
ncbi:MAG: DUF4153 domain-containing protein [Bacteroidia bacterium]|jgi:Leucine-rich repeat (LRR) protein/uncharacterized membrane protein